MQRFDKRERSTYRRGQNYECQAAWLVFIWTVNDLAAAAGQVEPFGAPTEVGPWWAGGEVEEYPEARIIHGPGDDVRVVAKTPRVEDLLVRAFALEAPPEPLMTTP